MTWHLITMLAVSAVLLLLSVIQISARRAKFVVEGGCFWGFLLFVLWLIYGGIYLW